MKRLVIYALITVILLVLPSCSFSKGGSDGSMVSEDGDIIIAPDAVLNSGLNTNQRSVGSTNNMYQQNVVNKLYDKISTGTKFIDFDVDEKRIYALKDHAVEVFDIDSSKLLYEIKGSGLEGCGAVGLKDSILYVYSRTTGDILKFKVDGKAAGKIHSASPGLYVEKLQIDDTGRIYMLVVSEKGNSIYIIGKDGLEPAKIERDDLSGKLGYPEKQTGISDMYIQDFCIKEGQSLIIKIFPERICLYDAGTRKTEKVSYIPDSARFMEFDSDILYYASGLKVAMFSNQVSNFSNEGSQDIVGRLVLDNRFPWSEDPESLGDFQLGDIIIPYGSEGSRHERMKQNNKYIFFLDDATFKASEPDNASYIYRLAK